MADGTKSPFGNGNGGSGGSKTGSNNFLTNPGGSGGGTGRDLMATQPLPTTTGEPPNADSIPGGGTIPVVTSPEENTSKPYKLGQ